jgi:signal peptidase I
VRVLASALRWTSSAVAVLLALVLVVPYLWTVVTGDRFLTVTGVSMKPTYQLGDMLLVQPARGDELTTVGQVVVASFDGADGPLYVHRVWEVTEDGAVLKGDANADPDPRPITQDQVVGTPRAHLDGLAATLLTSSQELWARAAMAALALVLGVGVPAVVRRFLSPRHRQDSRPVREPAPVAEG